MAQTPVTGGSGVPTGNALTDAANQQVLSVDMAAAASAINTVNQQNATVASDCLWPPSGQVSIPIIPGVFSQSVNIPCLVSYSEARALVGAGLLAAGLLVILWGAGAIAEAAGLAIAYRQIAGTPAAAPAAAGKTAGAVSKADMAVAA